MSLRKEISKYMTFQNEDDLNQVMKLIEKIINDCKTIDEVKELLK